MVTKSLKINKVHKRFADRYFKTGNAPVSYQDVYKCKPKSAKVGASRLLSKVTVMEYLQTLEEKMTDLVVQERVANETEVLETETNIIRTSVSEMLDENGDLRALKDMPAELQSCIKKIKHATDPNGIRYISEIQFWDKGGALNRLEKCYGMQVERKEIKAQLDIRMILTEIDGLNRDGQSLKLPQDCD
jgi:hypothetical protein